MRNEALRNKKSWTSWWSKSHISDSTGLPKSDSQHPRGRWLCSGMWVGLALSGKSEYASGDPSHCFLTRSHMLWVMSFPHLAEEGHGICPHHLPLFQRSTALSYLHPLWAKWQFVGPAAEGISHRIPSWTEDGGLGLQNRKLQSSLLSIRDTLWAQAALSLPGHLHGPRWCPPQHTRAKCLSLSLPGYKPVWNGWWRQFQHRATWVSRHRKARVKILKQAIGISGSFEILWYYHIHVVHFCLKCLK